MPNAWHDSLVTSIIFLNFLGVASRQCTGSPADWELPDLGDCVSNWMSDLSNQVIIDVIPNAFVQEILSASSFVLFACFLSDEKTARTK